LYSSYYPKIPYLADSRKSNLMLTADS